MVEHVFYFDDRLGLFNQVLGQACVLFVFDQVLIPDHLFFLQLFGGVHFEVAYTLNQFLFFLVRQSRRNVS